MTNEMTTEKKAEELCPDCGKALFWVEDEGKPRVFWCSCGYRSKDFVEHTKDMNQKFLKMLGRGR